MFVSDKRDMDEQIQNIDDKLESKFNIMYHLLAKDLSFISINRLQKDICAEMQNILKPLIL